MIAGESISGAPIAAEYRKEFSHGWTCLATDLGEIDWENIIIWRFWANITRDADGLYWHYHPYFHEWSPDEFDSYESSITPIIKNGICYIDTDYWLGLSKTRIQGDRFWPDGTYKCTIKLWASPGYDETSDGVLLFEIPFEIKDNVCITPVYHAIDLAVAVQPLALKIVLPFSLSVPQASRRYTYGLDIKVPQKQHWGFFYKYSVATIPAPLIIAIIKMQYVVAAPPQYGYFRSGDELLMLQAPLTYPAQTALKKNQPHELSTTGEMYLYDRGKSSRVHSLEMKAPAQSCSALERFFDNAAKGKYRPIAWVDAFGIRRNVKLAGQISIESFTPQKSFVRFDLEETL